MNLVVRLPSDRGERRAKGMDGDSVTFAATREELDALVRILAAGVDADPAISEVDPARAAELAARISAVAVAADSTGEVTLTMRELLEMDCVASAVSVLGNDPYFPELESLGEEATDRIATGIQALHDEARSVSTPSGESRRGSS